MHCLDTQTKILLELEKSKKKKKKKPPRYSNPLDFDKSVSSSCQITQNETFSREKTLNQSSKSLPNNSSLFLLEPFT